MHAQAHKLVGMNIQKVESKKRGLVGRYTVSTLPTSK